MRGSRVPTASRYPPITPRPASTASAAAGSAGGRWSEPSSTTTMRSSPTPTSASRSARAVASDGTIAHAISPRRPAERPLVPAPAPRREGPGHGPPGEVVDRDDERDRARRGRQGDGVDKRGVPSDPPEPGAPRRARAPPPAGPNSRGGTRTSRAGPGRRAGGKRRGDTAAAPSRRAPPDRPADRARRCRCHRVPSAGAARRRG